MKIELCQKCKHFQPESYSDYDGEGGQILLGDSLLCTVNKVYSIGTYEKGIFKETQGFKIPVECPYKLEHTIYNYDEKEGRIEAENEELEDSIIRDWSSDKT